MTQAGTNASPGTWITESPNQIPICRLEKFTYSKLYTPNTYLAHLLGGLDDDQVGWQVDPQGQRACAGQHRQAVKAEQFLQYVPFFMAQACLHQFVAFISHF